MTNTIEFRAFPKIARFNREWIITEKIDGTNAVVHVSNDGETVRAGSRTRWITPMDENFGFAYWVEKNAAELRRLGPGYHYGEWWGAGIQRRYDLIERRFSLFNVSRWSDPVTRPACCHVVPILGATSTDITGAIRAATDDLREHGSMAAPGFMRPEGVIVFHAASGALFKVTLEKDSEPKGRA